ncbi:peptidylprolyl isomerase [Fulvivirga sp. M361]|uniref:peptidylprolyl isomerase n=1 Tax=Fulvivirga sp. M361 TaxID=2594266 RepID=UPI00117B9911|nr:peptidylprolyl isomerase [Fulvivirga sp. M361]TRX61249.1 peptidylprolyl isomerase [Fulvivirga sp. M361]
MKKLLGISLVILSGCATQTSVNKSTELNPSKEIDHVLFSVGATDVGTEEFMYVYRKNNVNNDSAYTKSDIDEYFELYVKFKLKIQEALARGMDTTRSFLNEFNGYQEQLKKPYLTETKVTDSLMREAYDRFSQEINASHILLTVKPDASPSDTLAAFEKISAIRKQALEGGDFARLAKENSDDPSAKTNGGNLGYFTSFQMVYPFESAAYNTSEGDVSPPVRTRFGYHIIKILDKRPSQGSAEVSHIMIRVNPDKKDSIQARNKIFEIHDQAMGGVAWDELASQFSQDINTKDKGGRLRPFTVGQMPYAFQEASFGLNEVGAISDPFMTPYGWHIVRLEGKSPLQSYEEMEASIKSKINRDVRAELNKKALINRLIKENGFNEISGVKSIISPHADSSMTSGKWEATELASDQNVTLLSVGDRKYSLNDFLDFVEKEQKNNSYAPDVYLNILYDNFKIEKIVEYEEARLEEKYIDYRMLVKEYKEGILLFQLMEDEVWSKAVKDTVGLRQFYESHADDYQWKERVKATIYNAADRVVLEEIRRVLQEADVPSNKDLETKYNKESSLTLQIEEGDFEKATNKVIDQVDWVKGVYEVESEGRYNLVVVHEVKEAGAKALNETRGLVISDYQNELEERWISELREKYPVAINEAGLNYTYERLK